MSSDRFAGIKVRSASTTISWLSCCCRSCRLLVGFRRLLSLPQCSKFTTLNELHVLISILHCPENNVTPRTHRWGHPTDVYYVGNVIASATCTQWCDLQIGARPGSSVMDHVDVGLWCWNWRKFVFFCTPPLDKCLFQFQELTHQVFNFPTQHRQNFRQQLFGCHRRSYQSSCIDSQFVKREFTCIFFHGLAIPWRCAVLACRAYWHNLEWFKIKTETPWCSDTWFMSVLLTCEYHIWPWDDWEWFRPW